MTCSLFCKIGTDNRSMIHDTFTADDGEPLHVHLSGSGTPILLLHGWTASHTGWAPLMTALAAQHRVIRPDARGHGGHVLSVNPEPDVQRLARDIINLLDHYGLAQVAAVGHSMGALTLWQCLQDFGCERFSHLVFIDQSPKLVTDATWQGGIYGNFDATQSQRLIDELKCDFVEAVLRLIAFGLNNKARETYLRNSSGWRAAREALHNMDPVAAAAIWRSLVAADYRGVLPTIGLPTLLAYGTVSNFYTLETARYVAAHIAGARLSLYEGADHGPHLVNPERFVAELAELLSLPAGNASVKTA
jgi:pimeloyl-ACP methyl ester carboxylesterase